MLGHSGLREPYKQVLWLSAALGVFTSLRTGPYEIARGSFSILSTVEAACCSDVYTLETPVSVMISYILRRYPTYRLLYISTLLIISGD